jgi:hypothetical protein
LDLNSVNIEDFPCTNEAIRRLTSFGRAEMLDTTGISEFDYKPKADHSEVAQEGSRAREVSVGDSKATPTT